MSHPVPEPLHRRSAEEGRPEHLAGEPGVDRIAAGGKIPVLELETEGALNVKEDVPGAVTIFITAPIPELERRLRERASESEGEIGERIGLARKQPAQADEFDYVVLNDEVERAAGELQTIVQREVAAAGTMSRP